MNEPQTIKMIIQTILQIVIFMVLLGAVIWAIVWTASKILLRRRTNFIHSTVGHLRRPVFWTILILGIRLFLPMLGLQGEMSKFLGHAVAITLIICVIWTFVKLTDVLHDFIVQQYDIAAADNLSARKIHTQFRVLKRIVVILVCFLGFASILMTFEQVRQLGTSLMASAGLLGIIIGVAAQKTIHTFLTGIQIAAAQPIRLDDVVIVEGEWGRIEEITLTYVVVRIWDQRRLIVPITYFVEKPFQNWTRVSADILGTVFLYVDYTVALEPIRDHLRSIVEQSELWDKRVCVLQVTNAGEKTMELRALVSAADASKAWELRCQVREKLIAYIRDHYPTALPRLRAEWSPLPSA
jgi:small-conductance mechanosensitive channel